MIPVPVSIPSGNLTLDAEIVGDTKQPLLILCHGLASEKGSKTAIDLGAKLDNMAMLRFDFHCHGKSGGTQLAMTQAILDVESVITYARQQGFNKIGLYGSSFGGMAALHAASRHDDLSCLALKGTAASYKMEELGQQGKLIATTLMRGIDVPYRGCGEPVLLTHAFYLDAISHDSYAAAEKILCPTLLVHGDNDTVIPMQQCLDLKAKLPNARLMVLPGADHGFGMPQHYDEMLEEISGFIRRYC